MTMATNATSTIYSTGFADPNFLDSNQHSAKTDAYGIGISLLMALTGGEPSGLKSVHEEDIWDVVDGKEGAGGGLLRAARQAAAWPEAATRELVMALHGLVYERKVRRLPLPEALAAFEAALRFGSDDNGGADAGAAAAAAPATAERPTSSAGATSSGASASGASASASWSSGGGSTSAPGSLTRAVGGLAKVAVAGGGDESLARLQERISTAYLAMMGQLERRHEQRGGAPLPKGCSEEEKINALAPRSAGPLCDSAHTLRRWYNACRHERGQWSAGVRPSDEEVARVIKKIGGLLERLG